LRTGNQVYFLFKLTMKCMDTIDCNKILKLMGFDGQF